MTVKYFARQSYYRRLVRSRVTWPGVDRIACEAPVRRLCLGRKISTGGRKNETSLSGNSSFGAGAVRGNGTRCGRERNAGDQPCRERAANLAGERSERYDRGGGGDARRQVRLQADAGANYFRTPGRAHDQRQLRVVRAGLGRRASDSSRPEGRGPQGQAGPGVESVL